MENHKLFHISPCLDAHLFTSIHCVEVDWSRT